MKKTILLLGLLLVMIAWYPLLVITGWAQEFSVEVTYPLLTCFVLTLAFCAVSLYLLLIREKAVNATSSILSGLLAPLSVANLFAWVWENRSFWILILAAVWAAFVFVTMYTYGRRAFLRDAVMGGSVTLLVLLVLPCLLLTLVPFGRVRVVQTLPSPEGTYYAELIDDDQGALGGNTLVEVYDTRKKLDLYFLSVQKNPQQVYCGRWGEFQNMKLEWESEQVLLINGKAYEVE